MIRVRAYVYMTVYGKSMIVAMLSLGSMFAETSASIVGKGGAAARSSSAAQIKPKPLKWLRRACDLQVELPLMLSSHGIPNAQPSGEARDQTYRLAVQPDPASEGTPAMSEE